MPRTPFGDERGAAASALLVTAMLIALATLVYIALPFGDAADARAGSRTAADAAALAGAQQVRDDLLDAIEQDGWRGESWWQDIPGWSDLGQSAAFDFAGRNDATLTDYDFNHPTGEVSAAVAGRAVDGVAARSRAAARIGWPSCAEPDPPDEDGDDEDGDDEDEPPEFDEDEVLCDGFVLRFLPVEVDGEIRFRLTPDALDLLGDAMDVRLVS